MNPEVMARFRNYFGPGSDRKNRVYVQEHLPRILRDYKIKTVNDAGCGEQWVKDIVGKDARYRAFDIHPREGATQLDITERWLPRADLVICRDVLFHFTNEDVKRALRNFRPCKYMLLTSCYGADNATRPTEYQGKEINARLDMVALLGEPIDRIEEPFDKRFLGLWKNG